MPNQTVILNILDLLEIMEEGLTYIKQKVTELNIEATITVLSDTIDAFSDTSMHWGRVPLHLVDISLDSEATMLS